MWSKLKLLVTQLADLRWQRDVARGCTHTVCSKVAVLEDMPDDFHAFAKRIDAIRRRGYTPHIDDGVLINMAPSVGAGPIVAG